MAYHSEHPAIRFLFMRSFAPGWLPGHVPYYRFSSGAGSRKFGSPIARARNGRRIYHAKRYSPAATWKNRHVSELNYISRIFALLGEILVRIRVDKRSPPPEEVKSLHARILGALAHTPPLWLNPAPVRHGAVAALHQHMAYGGSGLGGKLDIGNFVNIEQRGRHKMKILTPFRNDIIVRKMTGKCLSQSFMI
ncbi:hypothetical protein BKA62DRAFT_728164 [Auriculariales sp. MPI-PUGE-AT-0066]|nr:hypothetical protein BKA62DRAFT_728164 [Auriculariales sp. MPI-PUGE-AT-0066]